MASEKRKKVVVSMEKILKPYKDYIKVKLQKVATEYGVGHVTIGDEEKKK